MSNNAPQKSLSRLDSGCRSLRDNVSDFEKGSVSPRNSATTSLTCDRWRLTESTALFYDGWELNAGADAQTGSITAVYLHGADIDEIIARADVSNATAPNAIVYYIHDHLGSVRALSNASGNIVESYQYEAFGKPTIFDASGNVIARSAFGNRFMFTGREYLDTIQLYDYRNRTYSPKWGRFIEVDPIRFEGRDLNLYRYVENRADIWTDPEGLTPLVIPVAAGAATLTSEAAAEAALIAAAAALAAECIDYLIDKLLDRKEEIEACEEECREIWDEMYEYCKRTYKGEAAAKCHKANGEQHRLCMEGCRR